MILVVFIVCGKATNNVEVTKEVARRDDSAEGGWHVIFYKFRRSGMAVFGRVG